MIKVLKLTTGEEIIGDVTGGDTVTIKEPCILQMVPSKSNPGAAMMALMPYVAHIKNSILDISLEHIVWEGEPIEELYNQYNSIFGTGIQLSSSKFR